MNWPVGQKPSHQGSGRRFLTKEQYLERVGQEACRLPIYVACFFQALRQSPTRSEAHRTSPRPLVQPKAQQHE